MAPLCCANSLINFPAVRSHSCGTADMMMSVEHGRKGNFFGDNARKNHKNQKWRTFCKRVKDKRKQAPLPATTNLDQAILSTADNPATIGAEADAVYFLRMAFVCLDASFSSDVPDF